MSDVSERAEAMLAKITPGPWRVHDRGVGMEVHAPNPPHAIDPSATHCLSADDVMREADAEFIAAAPDLVRDLLAEVRRLRGECGGLLIEREALQAKIDAVREICVRFPGMAHMYRLDEALGERDV